MINFEFSRRGFLRAAAIAGAAPLARSALAGDARPLIAYVGTFSSPLRDVLPTQVDLPPGNGWGIHRFQVDRDTGSLTPIGITEMGNSPGHLAINADGTRLYSANETDHQGDDKQGTISTFTIDPATGELSLRNTVRSGGAGPTNLHLHPSGRFLLVANYFGGSIAVLPLDADGLLGEAVDVKVSEGHIGPTTATNAPPGSFAKSGHDRTHAHQVGTDPSGRFVLHTDLGQDRIYIWKFDTDKGTLTPANTPFVALPPGDGPRHFHFHPNGRWFYSIQEEGSTVVRFDFDPLSGALEPKQTISTLPLGFAGSNFTSEILVSTDGRFVYAGNRLHDSIALFTIDQSGDLNYQGEEWTRGDYPRSFAIDPSGRFLYCANQRADHVTVFRVNRDSGALTFTGQYVPVGNPSCVVFLDLARRG